MKLHGTAASRNYLRGTAPETNMGGSHTLCSGFPMVRMGAYWSIFAKNHHFTVEPQMELHGTTWNCSQVDPPRTPLGLDTTRKSVSHHVMYFKGVCYHLRDHRRLRNAKIVQKRHFPGWNCMELDGTAASRSYQHGTAPETNVGGSHTLCYGLPMVRMSAY